jgi:hypothetical protein
LTLSMVNEEEKKQDEKEEAWNSEAIGATKLLFWDSQASTELVISLRRSLYRAEALAISLDDTLSI